MPRQYTDSVSTSPPTMTRPQPVESASSYFGFMTPPHRSPDLSSSPSSQRRASIAPESRLRNTAIAGLSTPQSALRDRFRHMQRGMTIDQVEQYGILDDEEKSEQFQDLDLDAKAIKKYPKKLRSYYEHLAVLKGHYKEVDMLLSGELPKRIANSFRPPEVRSSMLTVANNAGYQTLNGHVDGEGTTPWLHGSKVNGTATVPKPFGPHGRRASSRTIRASERQENPDVEAGERTELLSGAEKEEKRERLAKIALKVNTAVNILLVAAKTIAVLQSSSVSLLASLVDSALDTLSTFIIIATSYAIGIKSDRHLWPSGKRRFEPLGVLIFSVAMIASFVQVFIEAFNRARGAAGEPPVDLSVIGLSTMLATIGLKFILWIWCSRMPSSGVQALAQDAENDVYLNLMSLLFPWIGERVGWRLLDSIGGMVLSTYIIFEWVKTLLQNFAKLSGKTASRDQMTRVLYLCSRFNPVLEIGDVECYHIGDDLIVEVDIILPQASSLHFAHDVSETVQCVLESLDGVLRAYVHADYSSENPQQHTSRQTPTDAINLPDRQLHNATPPGSVTPTNKNLVTASLRLADVNEVVGNGTMQDGKMMPVAA